MCMCGVLNYRCAVFDGDVLVCVCAACETIDALFSIDTYLYVYVWRVKLSNQQECYIYTKRGGGVHLI